MAIIHEESSGFRFVVRNMKIYILDYTLGGGFKYLLFSPRSLAK